MIKYRIIIQDEYAGHANLNDTWQRVLIADEIEQSTETRLERCKIRRTLPRGSVLEYLLQLGADVVIPAISLAPISGAVAMILQSECVLVVQALPSCRRRRRRITWLPQRTNDSKLCLTSSGNDARRRVGQELNQTHVRILVTIAVQTS